MNELIALYEYCRGFLITLGLKPRELAYKREAIDEASPTEIRNGIKWLSDYREVKIGRYREARLLVPEERWKFYEAVYPDGQLWEQEQLAAAKQDAITTWKLRPNILRKVKHERFDRSLIKKGKRK